MKKLFPLFFLFLFLISPNSYSQAPSYKGKNPATWTKSEYLQSVQDAVKLQEASINRGKAAIAEIDARAYMDEGDRRLKVQQLLERSHTANDGSKVTTGGSVTQIPDKAKAAATLSNRLKNAADFAKKFGKASLPSFVGSAAVTGILNGVGWLMDEGGKVVMLPDPSVSDVNPSHRLYYYSSSPLTPYFSTPQLACNSATSMANSENNGYRYSLTSITSNQCVVKMTHISSGEVNPNAGFPLVSKSNQSYDPSYSSSSSVVYATDQQIADALLAAMNENNPDLAKHIADAIAAAYSSDKTDGQPKEQGALVSIGEEEINNAIDQAYKNPTPDSPVSRPSGYYKIQDGDKVIEGYVRPAPISTTPNPIGTGTGTGEGTGTGTGTGEGAGSGGSDGGFVWPLFCDWAHIFCEEPEVDELEVPYHDLDKQEIKDDLIVVSSSACPSDIDVDFNGLPFGISINETIEMQPYCNVLEPVKYVFYLITVCLCAFMFLRL